MACVSSPCCMSSGVPAEWHTAATHTHTHFNASFKLKRHDEVPGPAPTSQRPAARGALTGHVLLCWHVAIALGLRHECRDTCEPGAGSRAEQSGGVQHLQHHHAHAPRRQALIARRQDTRLQLRLTAMCIGVKKLRGSCAALTWRHCPWAQPEGILAHAKKRKTLHTAQTICTQGRAAREGQPPCRRQHALLT